MNCCDHKVIKRSCACHNCNGNACQFIDSKIRNLLTDKQVDFIAGIKFNELELFTADLIDAVDQLIQEWGN